jgi:hypothetical protein
MAYDVDDAFMLFKRREGGIHALRPSGGFVSPVTAARRKCVKEISLLESRMGFHGRR